MIKKVLVIAKTEPCPSTKYGATVCTAGITSDGQFIRLYPIPYRLFCDNGKKISRYDWIEVDCEKNPEDKRPESYKITNLDKIKIVGHFDCKNKWKNRNDLILPLISENFKELEASGASLGIIRPEEISNFECVLASNDTASVKNNCVQLIFDDDMKLKKIPSIKKMDRHYYYSFKCKNSDTKSRIMCEDWELYQSSRSWLSTYGTSKKVWEMMYGKYLTKFKNDNDLCFFVGTHYLWGTWIIIGLYYPPKDK